MPAAPHFDPAAWIEPESTGKRWMASAPSMLPMFYGLTRASLRDSFNACWFATARMIRDGGSGPSSLPNMIAGWMHLPTHAPILSTMFSSSPATVLVTTMSEFSFQLAMRDAEVHVTTSFEADTKNLE